MTAMFAAYADQHPGKAAALATRLLESTDERDHERGVALAGALRQCDRCAVCGRELKALGSRERGIGPECLANRSVAGRALRALHSAGFDVLDLEEEPHA